MNWFKNAKIRQKLFLVFGVIMFFVIILALFEVVAINKVKSDFSKINEGPNKRLTYASDAVGEIANIRRFILSMGYASNDNRSVNGYYSRYQESAGRFLGHLSNYQQNLEEDIFLPADEKIAHIQMVKDVIDLFANDYEGHVDEIYLASIDNNKPLIDVLVLDSTSLGNEISETLWTLRAMAQDSANEITAETQTYTDRVILLTVLLVFLIIALLFVTSIIIIYSINSPIEKMEAGVKEIAKGDLAYPIRSNYKDELGMLSNHIGDMVDTIATMNKTVRIVDAIDEIIFVTDLDFNVLYLNQYAADLYGFDREDSHGQKCYSVFYPGQEHVCETCPVPGMIADKESLPVCDWEQYDNDLGIWLACRTTFTRWVDGSLAQICLQKDNTLHKEQEERRRQHEESLRQAAQAAEEASRMKTSFLANMSHEIRTPMNGIVGFSELALDDDIPPKTRDYLNKIKFSAESLLQIINNILDISKVEAGKVVIEQIPFELHEIFKACQNMVEPKVIEKNIAFFCYAEPSVGKMLVGDPTKLRQVLLNLLSNAIKFTKHGMVKLLASTRSLDGDKVQIHFEVKDSGIGMTPEQLDKIFDPFMQADDSITRKYDGTGLGLSITKSMIELMGGEIEVESAIGIGSKFSFDLVFETITQSESKGSLNADSENMTKPCFSGEALVCEDNPMNLMVIRDHLLRVGIHTIEANDGKEGLDIVSERMEQGAKPFDIIFMDIHMPVMDGLETAIKLKDLGCKTPVIALTANVMSTDRDTYKAYGMVDCIGKPFTAKELWHCLLQYLTPVSTDTVDVHKQSDDNEKLQKKLVINFIKDNQTTAKDISSAIANGDIKLAHRLAHTLKGVSAMVGQDSLRDAAFAVERSLAGGSAEFIENKMDILSLELDAALNELSSFIRIDENQASETTVMGKAEILQLLEDIRPLVKDGNAGCVDFLRDLMAIPEAASLATQIEEYDFDLALETLDRIKNELERS